MTIERFIIYVNSQSKREQDNERRNAYQAILDYHTKFGESKRDLRSVIVARLQQALLQSRRAQGDTATPYLSAAQAYAHLRDVLDGRVEVQVPKEAPDGQLSLWGEV